MTLNELGSRLKECSRSPVIQVGNKIFHSLSFYNKKVNYFDEVVSHHNGLRDMSRREMVSNTVHISGIGSRIWQDISGPKVRGDL